jgi:hypothetical protein
MHPCTYAPRADGARVQRTSCCACYTCCAVRAVQRDLAKLGPLALLGVGSVGLFAGATVLLWAAAAAQVGVGEGYGL